MQLNFPLTDRGVRRLLYWLIGVELFLAAFHLLIKTTHSELPWGPLGVLFDLDEDRSVPSWFSIVQLFLIALVMLQITFNNRRREQVPNWLMGLGAAAFLLLSMDEGASLHERFTVVSRRLELDWLLFGEGRGAWIIPYLLVVTVSALLLWRPLTAVAGQYPREALTAGCGAAMVGVGAAGLELVSYYTVPDMEGLWYQAEVTAEEFLEMAGASLILYAALRLAGRLSLPVGSPSPEDR